MRFFKPIDLPAADARSMLCRESRWKKILFTGVCLTMMLLFLLNAVSGGSASFTGRQSAFLAAVAGLMGGIGFWYLRATFRPTNWLLRLAPEGVYVKFRSHLNDKFPIVSPTVVFFYYREIEWVRKRRERVSSMAGIQAKRTWSFFTFLDLKVRQADGAALGKVLADERNFIADIKTKKKLTVHHHYPVSITDNGVVQIEWKSPYTSITPNISKLLGRMREKILVEEEIRVIQKEIRDLTREEAEERNLYFVERGMKLDAIKILRYTFGYSIVDAKEYIEELLSSSRVRLGSGLTF